MMKITLTVIFTICYVLKLWTDFNSKLCLMEDNTKREASNTKLVKKKKKKKLLASSRELREAARLTS